jgi:hypothetical protein
VETKEGEIVPQQKNKCCHLGLRPAKALYFALRQKKDLHFQLESEPEYRVLKEQALKPGMSKFYIGVKCGKEAELGSFNIAVYWKSQYIPRFF